MLTRSQTKPKEVITGVEEVHTEEHEGIIIRTNDQEIKCLISGFQSCCEHFGFYVKENDTKIEQYDGLIGQFVTRVQNGPDNEDGYVYDDGGGSATVLVHLLNGSVLRLVVFNFHNGYYPHSYYRSWKGYEDHGGL